MFLWTREPAALLEVVRAGVILPVAFGLTLTDGQQAAILLFVSAVLTAVTRQVVTPTADPRVPD